MDTHSSLLAFVEQAFSAHLATPAQLTQDALTLTLNNGVVLAIRYAAHDAYSLRWRTSIEADAPELGIDTAPTHSELSTYPNHLHLADGRVIADPPRSLQRQKTIWQRFSEHSLLTHCYRKFRTLD